MGENDPKPTNQVQVQPVSTGVDAMIIPNLAGKITKPKDVQLLNENRAFAAQWKAKATGRATVELEAKSPLSSFTTAVKAAAPLARDHEVILFCGHGAEAAISSTNQSSFDTTPDEGQLVTHPNVILAEDLINHDFAEKKGDKFVPKPIGGIMRINQDEIDRKWQAKWKMFDDIGAAMTSNGVKRFRLLTCDVGADIDFVKRLAKILNIEVVAYRQFTVTIQHTFANGKKLVQLFVGPDPASGTPAPAVSGESDPMFTEIPHNDEAVGKP
jgi:hypothetical protein